MRTQNLIVAALVAAGGCNSLPSRETAAAADAVIAESVAPAPPPVAAAPASRLEMAEQAAVTVQADRKIIRTAEIRVELDDVANALRVADSIASAHNGLVASSRRLQGDRGANEAFVTLRVPAARFNDALASLREMGRVRMENTNAEDVTRAYNDLEIRLAVKRDLVTRLRALLNNRTARVTDLVAIERELGRAITELEQMEGERRYMDAQVAMATIHTSFFSAPIAGPVSFLDPIAVAVRQALVVLGQSIATIISALVFLTPWLVLAAGAWLGWRRFRRRGAATAGPSVANT